MKRKFKLSTYLLAGAVALLLLSAVVLPYVTRYMFEHNYVDGIILVK